MTYTVNFGILSIENIEYIKARVAVKKCNLCGKLARINLIDNKLSVDEICCEKFAKQIGDSLSIKNINDYAIKFRGKILNTFSTLEIYLDAIIELCSTHCSTDFKEILKGESTSELSMREKKKLFKICLEFYNNLTNENIEKIWGHFCNIVEKRNHLAHWAVDTSRDGLTLLEKTNKIRFVKMNRMVIVEKEDYNLLSSNQIEKKIGALTMETMRIYRFFVQLNESK